MDRVLVRWSEIGTKSRPVKGRMINQLHDRISERLAYAGIDYGLEPISGRLVITVDEADAIEIAKSISELPGVASTSPAIACDPTIDAIERTSDGLTVGSSFGVDANVAADHDIDSRTLNDRVGARIQARADTPVDLDEPETWVGVDVRQGAAYLFVDRYQGPGGFPVGVQRPLAALISGGIDSPVAAYEIMTRGADVHPIYFYNRPFASEDHLARFEAALRQLVRIHPGKDWGYHLVDMAEPNEALRSVDRGRLLLHRRMMFRVAERIATDEGLSGLVTGEAIGQKSSQTTANLELTTAGLTLPIHRPLLTWSKQAITEAARSLGTFELSTIPSACRSLAPESPATTMPPSRLDDLADDVSLDRLVERAYATVEYRSLAIEPGIPVGGSSQ